MLPIAAALTGGLATGAFGGAAAGTSAAGAAAAPTTQAAMLAAQTAGMGGTAAGASTGIAGTLSTILSNPVTKAVGVPILSGLFGGAATSGGQNMASMVPQDTTRIRQSLSPEQVASLEATIAQLMGGMNQPATDYAGLLSQLTQSTMEQQIQEQVPGFFTNLGRTGVVGNSVAENQLGQGLATGIQRGAAENALNISKLTAAENQNKSIFANQIANLGQVIAQANSSDKTVTNPNTGAGAENLLWDVGPAAIPQILFNLFGTKPEQQAIQNFTSASNQATNANNAFNAFNIGNPGNIDDIFANLFGKP
jgi:hypothetical protein